MNIPFILCCVILFSPVYKSEFKRKRLPIIYVPTQTDIPGIKNFKSYKSTIRVSKDSKKDFDYKYRLVESMKGLDTIISFRDSYLVKIEETPYSASLFFNLKVDVDFTKSEPIKFILNVDLLENEPISQFSNDSNYRCNSVDRCGTTGRCYIDDGIDTTKVISLNSEIYYVNISTKNTRVHNYKLETGIDEITTDIILQIKDSSHSQLRSYIIPVQYYLELVRPGNTLCLPEELVQSGGYIYYHPILSTPNHRTIYLSIKGDKAIKLEDPNDYE